MARGIITAPQPEAVEAGADHVQLTVIDGNEPALRLYARLGFRSYGRIRTILFS